jgi:hypothetical protein
MASLSLCVIVIVVLDRSGPFPEPFRLEVVFRG